MNNKDIQYKFIDISECFDNKYGKAFRNAIFDELNDYCKPLLNYECCKYSICKLSLKENKGQLRIEYNYCGVPFVLDFYCYEAYYNDALKTIGIKTYFRKNYNDYGDFENVVTTQDTFVNDIYDTEEFRMKMIIKHHMNELLYNQIFNNIINVKCRL